MWLTHRPLLSGVAGEPGRGVGRRVAAGGALVGLGYQIEPIIFPALYTWLALQVGTPGWIVIALIGVTAAVVAHPAARAAERHLVRIGAPVGA
jgi:hypothetical protein